MDVAKVYSDVAYLAMAKNVYCLFLFKMFHLFQTYVRYCVCFTHMLQVNVSNILAFLDVCCGKCFMFSSVYS
jgi:hypothetical protein